MDYTLSNSYDTDAGTGNRMHEDSKAVPTVVSDIDMNSLIWSAMEIVKAAGLAGIQFDKANTASYRLLLKALRSNGLIRGVDTGAANALVVALTPALDVRFDGMVLWVKAKATNTGATTLNDGLGAAPVVGAAHTPLQGGEIIANGACQFVWSATLGSWVLVECTGAALQVGPAVASGQALQLAQLIGSVASASSGHFKIPFIDQGGVKRNLIVQYGTQPGTVASGTLVTFPVAYPNVNLGVFGNVTQNNATLTFVLTPSVLTLSGFVLNKNYVGATQFGNSADPANWLSIGY